MGKLKTYQLFDRVKTRLHLSKLNSETLRKSAPRVWTRIEEHDDDFATDLSQAILVSHLDMIKAVLDHLGVPHEDGFFAKDADVAGYLKEGWQQRRLGEISRRRSRPRRCYSISITSPGKSPRPRMCSRLPRNAGPSMKELFEAIRAGDSSRVAALVAADPSLAIFAASIQGDTAQDRRTAGRQSIAWSPRCRSDGWTPLHLAAFFGKADAARLLLNKGAAGERPLHQSDAEHAAARRRGGEARRGREAADRARRDRECPPARRLDSAARRGAERRPRNRRKALVAARRRRSEARADNNQTRARSRAD